MEKSNLQFSAHILTLCNDLEQLDREVYSYCDEHIEEVFEKLGKKVSFLDSLCLRYRVLKLHRILLEEDRYKQRCLWQIKKIGKDLR